MAEPDSPFPDTTVPFDLTKILEFLRGIIGDPTVAGMLSMAMERALGNTFRSTAMMPGGVPMPYGSTTLFGPTNVGRDIYTTMQDQAVTNMMTSVQQATITQQLLEREQWHRMFAPSLSADEVSRRSMTPNFTNFLQGFVHRSTQPQQLLMGLEEGMRYMGAGATMMMDPMSQNRQLEINRYATMYSEGVNKSFLAAPETYGGLMGTEVGIVSAELGRTGAYAAVRGTDEQRVAEIQRITQDASRTVAAFRQVFSGSVAEVMDQINQLMGVDVVQTFGPGGPNMARMLAATGQTVGFNPQQMASLAMTSREYSMGRGLDPMGSVANASLATQLWGTLIRPVSEGGTDAGTRGNFMVNESRFRQGLVQHVAEAQESGLSRDLAGAYALIEQSRPGAGAGFIQNLGSGLNSGNLAAQVQNFLGTTVTPGMLRNVSYTPEAEIARARGLTTTAALSSDMELVQTDRRAMLNQILSNEGVDSDAVFRRIGGGALTLDTISTALTGAGVNATTRLNIEGELGNRFRMQATALGMGNEYEMDQQLRALSNRRTLQTIQTSVNANVQLQEMFQDRGTLSGLSNLRALESAYKKGGNRVDIKGFLSTLLGKESTGIDMDRFFGGIGADIDAAINPDLWDRPEDPIAYRTTMDVGISSAFNALQTGMMGGKWITDDQRTNYQKALDPATPTAERMKLLEGVAKESHSAAYFETRVSSMEYDVQQGMRKPGDKEDPRLGPQQRGAIRKLAMLQQLTEMKPSELMTGTEKEREAFMDKAIQLRDTYVAAVKDPAVDIEAVEEKVFGKGKEGEEAKRKWVQDYQREARINQSVVEGYGGLMKDGTIGGVVSVLQDIFNWLQTSFPFANQAGTAPKVEPP